MLLCLTMPGCQNLQEDNKAEVMLTGEDIAFNEQINGMITGYTVETADEIGQEMMGYDDEEYEDFKSYPSLYDSCMELVRLELPEGHVRIKVYMTITNKGNDALLLQPFSGEEDEDIPMPLVYLVHPNLYMELPFRAVFLEPNGEWIPEGAEERILKDGTAEAQIELAILETELPKINEYFLRFESNGKVFEWAFDNQLDDKSKDENLDTGKNGNMSSDFGGDSGQTVGEQNALESARQYLDFWTFSYSGLVEQLEFEGYSNSEATYAADHCGADWYQQAARCAKEYLESMSFSREGLIEQLEYEGFAYDQAVYGVEQNGY